METIEKVLNKSKYIRADLEIKAKELKIIGYSKMNKSDLIEAIMKKISDEVNVTPCEEKIIVKTKKQTLSKPLRNAIWDKHIGMAKGVGECFCCNKEIDSKHFECGHIVSEFDGGTTIVDNMRPVCSLCNKSMGTKNMIDFKKELHLESKIVMISELMKEYKMFDCDTSPQKPNVHDQFQKKAYAQFDAFGRIVKPEHDGGWYEPDGFAEKAKYHKVKQQADDFEKNNSYGKKLFENITDIWCLEESYTLLIEKYGSPNEKSKEYNEQSIYKTGVTALPSYGRNLKDYLCIDKNKLVQWFNMKDIIVVDVDYKKIIPIDRVIPVDVIETKAPIQFHEYISKR